MMKKLSGAKRRSALLPFAFCLLPLLVAMAAPQQAARVAPVMPVEQAAAFVEAARTRSRVLPGEVVVKFRDGVSLQDQAEALASASSVGRAQDASMERRGRVAVMRTSGDTAALANQLRRRDDVEYAEPNYLYRIEPRTSRTMAVLSERDLLFAPRATVPNDPGFAARQWNFNAIDLPRAWDIAPGASASVIIAIVDSGVTNIDGTIRVANWNGAAIVQQDIPVGVNADLPASRLAGGIDLLTGSAVVVDTDGHGTHVSSTAAEEANNGIGGAGIAYRARIMPVKVCASFWDVQFAWSAAGRPGQVPLDSGGCSNADVAQGIRYAADNGARVINLSLGGEFPSAAILDAIKYAVGKGAFIAAAGGNEFEEGNPVEYPAADAVGVDGFMSVAATNRSGNRAYYSNTGAHLEIAAPGGDARDSAGGNGLIWQSTLVPDDSTPRFNFFTPRFDRYTEVGYTGTSMATPHVAGTAALMISRGITPPAVIETILRRTAKDLGATGKDTSFGYGLIQPRTALFGTGAIR